MSYYLDGIVGKMVGLVKDPYQPLTVPYLYKINSVEPPRHDLESHNFKEMAGYRCARDLKKWNKCDEDVSEAHNCAMFNVYNNRLRERRRRYKIIKEHGLLVANRTLSWLSKYSEALGSNQSSNGKTNTSGRFIAFMQLMSGVDFDSIVEALQYAHDLKKYVFRLYEVRKNGIESFHGGKIFHRLRAQRLSKIRDKRADQFNSQWEWKQLMPSSIPAVASNNPLANLMIVNAGVKRKSTPLDILGLPSYDKLTEDEKELCSTIRLVPTAYLSYKSMLMSENTKSNNLRLADARRLIKIDVNKTRQLYDFLLKSGFINKPET
ncbi:hypothetical protein HA402_003338 [Bradysia odoriphaga]|nr:hypothetical protein HA402_003338 [Bradysia odoriphaga]